MCLPGNGIELATAYVALTVDASGIPRDTDRVFNGIERRADSAGRKSGKSLSKGLGSSLSGGIAGMASKVFAPLMAIGAASKVGEALGNFITDAVSEARESQKVSAITAQIVKQTGGAAKITADQIGDLANAISRKTGVDDEQIQSSANLLLTFKKVRNEAGKGNDIFSRATAAAQDMAATGFGDANSAAKMLGKALNDPLKGITALGRAGVTFTDGQKKQIKGLVEQGNVLQAQKMIMREVESQVGGTAAASATAGEKMSVAWGNFKESIGTKMLPILDRFGNWFVETGLPAVERFGGWITGSLWPALEKGYRTIFPGIQSALQTVNGGLDGSGIRWKDIGDFISTKFIPVVATIVRYYLPFLAAQWRGIIEILKVAWAAFKTGWSILSGFARFAIARFGDLLDAAVYAFGWVPGLGPKLKSAQGEFRKFAAGVNAALDRIDGNRTVNIGVKFRPGSKLAYDARHQGIATGGYVRLADGGVMPGYTPGRDVHRFYSPTAGWLELSGGEPVLRPEVGRVVGPRWVNGVNAAARKGGTGAVRRFLGGYASGGFIATSFPPMRELTSIANAGVLKQIVTNLKALRRAYGPDGAAAVPPGSTKGVMGWQKQWAWLKAAYPSAVLTSSYRPGAITASGNRSYHSMGRAIDVTPSMAIFNLIRRSFGSAIRELIYSPAGGRQVKNGRPYYYTGAVRAMHYNHVHWAMNKGGIIPKPLLYDQGGILPPTRPNEVLAVQNLTGRPERVIPPGVSAGMSEQQFQRLMDHTARTLAGAIRGRDERVFAGGVGR